MKRSLVYAIAVLCLCICFLVQPIAAIPPGCGCSSGGSSGGSSGSSSGGGGGGSSGENSGGYTVDRMALAAELEKQRTQEAAKMAELQEWHANFLAQRDAVLPAQNLLEQAYLKQADADYAVLLAQLDALADLLAGFELDADYAVLLAQLDALADTLAVLELDALDDGLLAVLNDRLAALADTLALLELDALDGRLSALAGDLALLEQILRTRNS